MKLAKKMLVSVLALAMVAALALTAFAAAPTLTADVSDAEVGKEVTITVSAKDMVGTQTATLYFQFDTDALEFVDSKSATTDGSMGVTGMKLDSTDTVSFALMYAEAAQGDTALVTMTFKVLKAGDTTITGTVDAWTGTDAVPEGITITVAAHEPTTAPETTTAPATEPVSADETTTARTPSSTTNAITQTGEAGVAAIAGVMALAAVAFVATRKKDEE